MPGGGNQTEPKKKRSTKKKKSQTKSKSKQQITNKNQTTCCIKNGLRCLYFIRFF
jgi:hypothetical protein